MSQPQSIWANRLDCDVAGLFLTTHHLLRLSIFPNAPDFFSAEAYYKYLEGYIKEFGLTGYIQLETPITKVKHGEKGGHVVFHIQEGQDTSWTCDAVAICSGPHVTPNIPIIEGIENVPTVIHSFEFKNSAQFGIGKDVFIVGNGVTGMDIAFLAVTGNTKSVTLRHQDGFHIDPKVCSS